MYLLIREVSPYVDNDMLLGVFASRDDAVAAATACIETLRELGDPFAQQPYRRVDLERDLRVQEFEHISSQHGATVYLVSELLSGMGQVVRKTSACFVDLVDAVNQLDEIEANDGNEPREAIVQSFVVGTCCDPRDIDAPVWPELCFGVFLGIDFEVIVQIEVRRMSCWGRIEPAHLTVDIDLAHALPEHAGGAVRVFFDGAGRVLGVFGSTR